MRLAAQGAEFMVLGHLLIEGIQCYKAYTNFPGFDLIAVNPDTKKIASLHGKMRSATNSRRRPISSVDCDVVVHEALNRGYRGISPTGNAKQPPKFYIFPVDVVRNAQNPLSTWGKSFRIYLNKIENVEE